MPSHYAIKSSYAARPAPDYYADTERPRVEGKGIIWQPEVYAVAARAARRLGCGTILDIGCGSATKLAPLHPEFDIIGVDYGPNIAHCRAAYPFGRWLEADFEKCHDLPLAAAELSRCVIVCSDVIEHLVDPQPLLRLLARLLQPAPLAIISTPERNLKHRSLLDLGPPSNPHHVREWTLGELSAFARSLGLKLAYAGLTITNDLRNQRSTILLGAAGESLPSAFAAAEIFPPTVNPLHYWFRVLRKTFGEARASLSK